MAINIFMQITNQAIVGNSTVKGETGAFEVLSLSYGAAGAPSVSSGAGAGKPSFSSVTVTLAAYNGPQLLDALASGSSHSVRITVGTATGGVENAFEIIQLTNAVVSLFQETISVGSTNPMFELAFVYEQIEYTQVGIDFTFQYFNHGG